MIGGIDNSSMRLASAYNANNEALANTLSRIASGKKISRPSDDFSGYVRASLMQSDIDSYQTIKENLTAAKASTGVAVEIGNSVYEDLVELKSLVTSYYNTSNSASDNAERTEIKTKFDNLKTSLTSLISNTRYEGAVAYSASTLESVKLDPDGTSTLSVTFEAGDIAAPATPTITGFIVSANPADVAADDITNAASLVTDTAAIDAEIAKATSYLVKAESYDKSIDRQINISNTIIQSKQSAISMITDIDEVSEMNKQTDLQVRQQATIAMMAQANMTRSSIARLFE